MEVARIEGFRCCGAAWKRAYLRSYAESPNTKSKVPQELQIAYDPVEIFGVQVLEIGILLGFGIWVLELSRYE